MKTTWIDWEIYNWTYGMIINSNHLSFNALHCTLFEIVSKWLNIPAVNPRFAYLHTLNSYVVVDDEVDYHRQSKLMYHRNAETAAIELPSTGWSDTLPSILQYVST